MKVKIKAKAFNHTKQINGCYDSKMFGIIRKEMLLVTKFEYEILCSESNSSHKCVIVNM